MNSEVDVWADDFMGRKPSSDFLTKYILANDHVKVLNVNSPWGAGKTFFLTRWKEELSKSHVCVMFNAWETDYSAEPLLALITCIEQQTKDKLDITSSATGRHVVNTGSKILKKAAPLIAKGLVKKFVGVEIDDLFGKDTGDDTADAAKDLVSSLIEDQAKTAQHVDEFKKAIVERLSSSAQNDGLSSPAFIFIDELDRCRPTYAIELLERIKHFFELDDCRFIIASDSKQLAHSIRAVYGQGFASERYLNRFFDAEFSLDNSNPFELVHRILPEIDSLVLGVNVSGELPNHHFQRGDVKPIKRSTIISPIKGFTENSIFLVGMCRYFNVELRELNNYAKQIKSAADTVGEKVHFFWLAYLVFFKSVSGESYQDLWVPEKWAAAIDEFESVGAKDVTFSFTTNMATVKDFASFYLTILHADRERLRAMSSNLSSWKSTIYFDLINGEIEKLRTYRGVVELAHRLV